VGLVLLCWCDAAADPLERGRRDVELLALPDIGLLGRSLNAIGINYNYTRQPSPPGPR